MTNELIQLRFGGLRITETEHFPPAPDQHRCYFYATLNAEIALMSSEDEILRAVINSERAKVSIDGQWILWALRKKYPGLSLRKLSGSDLIYRLAAHCQAVGQRLFLLGGSSPNNDVAVNRLSNMYPELSVCGFSPPYFDSRNGVPAEVRAQIRKEITDASPDYIVCCFGTPKEQHWAWDERDWLDGRAKGVFFFGGAVDFVSGRLKRAPWIWQVVGLEGLYRVIQQPGRFRRLLKVCRIIPVIASRRY